MCKILYKCGVILIFQKDWFINSEHGRNLDMLPTLKTLIPQEKENLKMANTAFLLNNAATGLGFLWRHLLYSPQQSHRQHCLDIFRSKNMM